MEVMGWTPAEDDNILYGSHGKRVNFLLILLFTTYMPMHASDVISNATKQNMTAKQE